MIFAFADCVLDCRRRELRRGGLARHVEPQVFDVLTHLVRHCDRVVSKDELMLAVWGDRIVSEDTLTSRISAARRAIGDTGGRQDLIQTMPRRGFRFISQVRELPGKGGIHDASAARHDWNMDLQEKLTSCRSSDGTRLQIAAIGTGLPLVKAANWLTHIEYDWRSPIWSPLLAHLAAQCRLTRYDQRGSGLSYRDPPSLSFEACVDDLETVADTQRLERFSLMGISQGAAVSIAYAARHPERVSKLILCGAFATGWRQSRDAGAMRQSAVRAGEDRGLGLSSLRPISALLSNSAASPEEVRWWAQLERISISPENALRLLREIGDIDVTELLPELSMPVLVLHSRGDPNVPFAHGVALARAIPNARFVPLESNNHFILSVEPAWPHFLRAISTFLNGSMNGNCPS